MKAIFLKPPLSYWSTEDYYCGCRFNYETKHWVYVSSRKKTQEMEDGGRLRGEGHQSAILDIKGKVFQ